jgi:hypothetical protein
VILELEGVEQQRRSSLLTSDTAGLQLHQVAALRLGPVELLVGALDPQPGVERTHCGAKAPPMLTVTSICCAPGDRSPAMRSTRRRTRSATVAPKALGNWAG